MNAPIKDGGAAFPLIGVPFPDSEGHSRNPCDGYGWAQDPQAGMTLRDYFAAKAMQGDWALGNACGDFLEDAARYYKMADAMLAAREVQS